MGPSFCGGSGYAHAGESALVALKYMGNVIVHTYTICIRKMQGTGKAKRKAKKNKNKNNNCRYVCTYIHYSTYHTSLECVCGVFFACVCKNMQNAAFFLGKETTFKFS